MKIQQISSITLPDNRKVSFVYENIKSFNNFNAIYYLPYLKYTITDGHTNEFLYEFKPDHDDNFYGPPNTKAYEPCKVTLIKDNGITTQIFEKVSQSYDQSENSGSAQMKTTTDTGTVNEKHYTMLLDRGSMQWLGFEIQNTLDDQIQNKYDVKYSRGLYSAAYSTPDNGETWQTNRFDYDQWENLTAFTDPYGFSESSQYKNGKDQILSTNPRGTITTNIFDSAGNLLLSIEDIESYIQIVESNSITTTNTIYSGLHRTNAFSYNIAGQQITATDPLGRTTKNFYDQSGNPQSPENYASANPSPQDTGFLVATCDPLNRVTTFTYDTLGRKTIVNAPGNNGNRYIVRTTYDILDRQTSTHYPDGTFTSNVYNNVGYPVYAFDREGRVTTNTWDAAGHLVRVDFPNGDYIEKEYSGNLVTKLTDGAGNVTRFYYDHEQLVAVQFPDDSKRVAGFDNLNNQIWAIDERGIAVTNSYDLNNRLVFSQYTTANETMPADSTALPPDFDLPRFDANNVFGTPNQSISYSYDPNGNVISLTDWVLSTSNAYDSLDRLVYKKETPAPNSTIAPNYPTSIWKYAYNLIDNRTNYTLKCHQNTIAQSYAYDALNRLSATTLLTPDKPALHPLSSTYTYNLNNKLATQTVSYNAGDICTKSYTYDAENRLIELAVPGFHTLNYTYNDAQQIISITESAPPDGNFSANNSFSYDARDQLTKEVTTGTTSRQIDYVYDKAQNRTESRIVDAPVAIPHTTNTHEYIVANKLISIDTTGATEMDADHDNLTIQEEIGHGTDPNNPDSDGDSIDDGVEVAQNTCPWSADSDADGLSDATDPAPLMPKNAVWFGAKTSAQQWQLHWWKDSTSKPIIPQPETTADHLYWYDDAGNLTSNCIKGVYTHYKYNPQNKLTQIVKEDPGGDITYEFIYDSQNRRIGLVKNGEKRYDIHDGMTCIAIYDAESDSIGTIFHRGSGLASGTGDLIAEIADYAFDDRATPHVVLANHRGDTVMTLDATSGAISSHFHYDAFGNVKHTTGTFSPTYTFSTKEYLEEVNLYLYAYRAYDPISGRWTQRDPIDYQDSINLYQFCGNNPVNGVDEYGLAPNQEGVTNPSQIQNELANNPNLSDLRDNHINNENRYFYTEEYGWVDVRHFAETARRTRTSYGWWVKLLGYGNEAIQWITEWGDDYRSGFSPEDIPSNAAGVSFGKYLNNHPDVSEDEAFALWCEQANARNIDEPEANTSELPLQDPSVRGGANRGASNFSSTQ